MSENFIRLVTVTHWTAINKRDWRVIMENFFHRISDWRWIVTSLMASSERVVCRIYRDPFTEPYPIMPGLGFYPQRRVFTDYDCDCFEVKDGLITEIRAYVTNEIDRKFGFVFKDRRISCEW